MGQTFGLPISLPFLLLWSSAPFISRWSQQGLTRKVRPLEINEIDSYRRYARLTWHFFEKFLDIKDHWLAPDNYQEDPKPVVAIKPPHKHWFTIACDSVAYDFGYLGLSELVEHLEKIFATLGKLETMNGHFYNWYDTLTLHPLHPLYISSVDSGNPAAFALS